MYRNKKDVDKHVETLLGKLTAKEFNSRAYSVARLYFEVGDFPNCQKYVEKYLTQKDNNAAAYKLLGQALQKMGLKEKALEQYKASLDIDPAQTSTILDICELLADDEVIIEPGRAKYWCEKAEAIFPRHPVTFRLRERLIAVSNPDPEALIHLLHSELAIRPKDPSLHARLLNHYLNINQVKEAFEHACNVEFGGKTFINNYGWYEILNDLLKHNSHNTSDWLYQLLLLTVKERICLLSITESPSGSSKSLIESSELLHAYDQAIESVSKLGASPGFGEFHNSLLQHHRGQVAFHAATLLLKKAKKDQLSWRDATKFAAPLMLVSWQTVPLDSKVNWLRNAPEKQTIAVNRWYSEGTYRCSQAGHYLLSNIQEKNQSFLDQVSQCFSGTHWRDKLYKKIFSSKGHLDKIKSSYFASNAFTAPVLRLPRKIEVESYDGDAQREYGSSLHHFVWTLLNYKNYAYFKCTLFDMLTYNATTCGPETLNRSDIHAFLYCATLTTNQQISKKESYVSNDKPPTLPANITDLLCSLTQMKWWDCAYKFSQNELGTELTDIRATLSRGIEVVRCIDNHGLDPELLCTLGRIFSERAKMSTNVDEKAQLEIRAGLYYSSAVPLLEKLRSKIVVKFLDKRMFDYTHKGLGTKELNALLEECKLYVAVNHFSEGEYDKVIEILSNLKSPQALYHLSQTYKKIASEENNLSRDPESRCKYAALLSKAKMFAYKALDRLRDSESNKNHPLYSDTQELIEAIETQLNKIDPDFSTVTNDGDGRYSSEENVSGESELPIRGNAHIFRNISSTPKAVHNANATNYRTAMDSQILENSRIDQQYLGRIENEIKNLQKRDTTIGDFMEQTRNWFDENRKMGNQIISTIQSNMQNTTDQFKLLKISVDQVKDQIDECRNECKDVSELKKQVAELKKEVGKLKKASSEQTIDDSDLYNLDEEYRTNDSTSSFAAQLPFAPSQVIPSFNQRLVPPFPVPPNPYLYNQSLYNLYNQYSQFAQPSSVPGTQPMFDPTRTQVNYPGVYPTPDQMYLDVAHLVPPNLSSAPTAPSVPVPPTLSSVPTMPGVSSVAVPPPVTSVTMSKTTSSTESKDTSRALPVNVVITSSDPLPTCTTTPAPILSVTIPPKHIKGTPHNYQIQLPSTSDTTPPVFVFPAQNNKTVTTNPVTNWNQSSVFKSTPVCTTSTFSSLLNSSTTAPKLGGDSFDSSRSVVDGPLFGGYSPNTSLNKSRTISERSNTSVDNYDPCPDFKPIVPLPAEVKVTTGEEDEYVIFSSRAKLFRFVDKQWKERGLGEMKLLKHKTTGKVRVLMRREQVHKICANHIITAEMEIKQMMNETKAYFWVANDFADETVVLEKFCIRFKTADIAQDFYNAFEKARQESALNKTLSPVAPKDGEPKSAASKIVASQLATPNKDNTVQPTPAKAVVGGFTFISTPTFKPVSDDAKPDTNTQEVASSKANVFSGLSFKTTTSSPFTNLFGNISSADTSNSNNTTQASEPTKLNTSDQVEEYEPNVEFKPVVPLPALVDQKTGEEDETILFEHRAKLLRFDAAAKEWKERGLGNIKLLVHKDNIQKVRLLMRREQIMKVCCNHAVTNEMVFHKMPNLDKAVTWCAKDYSEGELVAETFCLRFKTIQLCDEFIEAVKSAQSKMKDESKAAKEVKNAAKQNNQTGFGEKFKPKAGSWHCDACYTNNLESFAKCACCETPKPNSSTTSSAPTTVNNTNTETKPVATVGWGDKFKPKAGSWECKDCLVRNEPSLENCSACNSPKDPTKAKTSIKLTSDSAPKFNFGIPKTTSNEEKPASIFPVTTQGQLVGTGADLFKSSAPTSEANNKTSIFGTASVGPQFRFGIPPAANDQKPNAGTTSIFDGTGAHKFSFGVPSNNIETSATPVSFGDQKPPANNVVFDAPKTTTESQAIDFSFKKNQELSTPVKPALLPTPQTDSSSNVSFGFKESGTFDFVFKPKTPTKGKSPAKSPHSQRDGEESDDNEYAAEDECYHPFTPVIPLPDKVEVVTGEENETEIYGQLAKLYRFSSGEWKERGKGIVKILKHKDTGKLRVVMRREQVLKICLNHALTPEIIYNVKDEKSWQFIVNDFSEGELNLEHFCLRFKGKEVAQEFKDAIDNALQGKPVSKKEVIDNKEESDDVVFVSEIQATSEEKQKAKELMLPENFFTYKNKDPCQGCRGCHDSDDSSACGTDSQASTVADDANATLTTESNITNAEQKPVTVAATLKASLVNASTPVKTTTPLFQSPTNSIYGTPSNFEKTVDTSIFRTPLGSLASNAKTPTSTSSQSSFGSNTTNKENTFIQKPSIFTGFGEQTMLFGSPQNKAASIFGSGDSQVAAGAKNSLLAPPKLSNINTSNENKLELNSNFGGAPTKFVFSDTKQTPPTTNSTTDKGMSFNRSVLEFSAANAKTDGQNNSVKSIFGDDNKSENLFTSVNQGSIFGPGALANSQAKIGTGIFGPAGMSAFGSLSSQNSIFGGGKSIFGSSNQAPTSTTPANVEQPKVESVSFNTGGDHKPKETVAEQQPEKKETPFSVDNSLSFAALSSGTGSGFGIKTIQKQPDFKWEGAGQQLFVAKPGNHSGDKSKNESGEGDDTGAGADEEYDPHYEPIVPLPDKIVVTTGEEDEEKIYGERCKLYRYDEKSREWKERGVGEMKVLFYPERKTYRLLLRREQVHKAVLNMLLYMDLQLLPMKNSDRAWTWAGRNFAENSAGEQETLAVRFKTVDQATAFHDKIVECVRKLQASAAQAVREEKEAEPVVENTVSKLRLPKHLEESARADNAMTAQVFQRASVIASAQEAAGNTTGNATGNATGNTTAHTTADDTGSSVNEVFKQVHFQESEEDHDDEEEDYDYDGYYNEDEEESAAYYTCDGEAIVRQGNNETTCSNAHIQVLFDQEIYSPKILVTDASTGEILADMLIYTDTEFQMSGDSCIWSGTDYTSNDPVDKTVTINFYDSETAMQFYDSCETSKANTYASTDPES